MGLYIFIIILASFVLVKSSHWVIKSLTYIAQYLHIPEFVVAFILAGFATSLPELFVGINSAFNQIPILSLGNVLGSNIANLTLVLGLTIIFTRGLKSENRIIQRNIVYTLIVLIYPLLLCLDGELSRTDGLALIVVFVLYNIILFYQSKDFSKKFDRAKRKDLIKKIFFFFFSISLLLFSAHLVVHFSQLIALELKISLFIIGLFLIAIGTSLPELAFGIRAVKEKQKDMILGNILGSLANNSSIVLGVTALISPIIIKNTISLALSAGFLILVYFFFIIFARSNKNISWREGFILLFFYLAFIVAQFLLK